MFRTTIKIVSAVLAAAAVAVPVASAGSHPRTPSVGQGFSLGVPLQYLRPVAAGPGATTYIAKMSAEPTTPRVGQGFSLGVPLQYLNGARPTHATQGFSLGVPLQYLAPTTEAGHSSGFDWSSAGIGAGLAAGAFLLIGGVAAMAIRACQGQRKLRTT